MSPNVRRQRRPKKITPPGGPSPPARVVTRRQKQSLDLAEFWDSLSHVPLCRRALREFNRRNPPPIIPAAPVLPVVETGLTKDLGRFSRHGGPNIRGIRGVSCFVDFQMAS